jgi:hypothetical protein
MTNFILIVRVKFLTKQNNVTTVVQILQKIFYCILLVFMFYTIMTQLLYTTMFTGR